MTLKAEIIKPVTEHETGSTFLVLGLIMLIAALGWMLFVGWDIRAGGGLMQAIFAADVVSPWSVDSRIYQKETANKLDGRHNPCNC